ncbi:MAG: LysM peptidoglycan-binding domain-containing protein [Deltaproteobacteria bacterium]|nr:LysM peptidoglycan-binding domain-containing protein [Deltaproteobacteria bacterium]
MRVAPIAAALALVPALALGQSQALEAAKQARTTAEQASEARAAKADAQAVQGDSDPGTVDLGAAAEQLENPGTVEGTVQALPPGGAVAPPDTYTVKPGDTLWDLSGRFLNNPWYWPKVWSYNPEVTNPHWIYPGNMLRFFPAAEGQPARVEPVPAPQAAPEEPLAEQEGPRELEDLTRADLGKAQDYGEEDAVAVTGPYKVGYVAPRGVAARRETFITRRELAEAGGITGAFEDKMMLTVHDRAYAEFHAGAAPRVGQSFVVFRTVRPVTHPRTGEMLGYQTQLIGTAKAVAAGPKVVTLIIQSASEPIERGDYLGPQTERLVRMVARRPNQRQLDGSIVSTDRESAWLAAEHHMVFVDRGRADGVEEGNVFTVLRAGDPYAKDLDLTNLSMREDRRLPSEDIGELLVVDAKENYSTALVVRSLRELAAGDRVEMRQSRGAAAPGSGGY